MDNIDTLSPTPAIVELIPASSNVPTPSNTGGSTEDAPSPMFETTYPPTPGPDTDEVSSIYGHDISSLDICIVSLCVLILIIITFHYVYSARACDTISYHR